MSDKNDTITGVVAGIIISLIVAYLAWIAAEEDCRIRHAVAYCEWTRSPFTPPKGFEK